MSRNNFERDKAAAIEDMHRTLMATVEPFMCRMRGIDKDDDHKLTAYVQWSDLIGLTTAAFQRCIDEMTAGGQKHGLIPKPKRGAQTADRLAKHGEKYP